MALTTDQKTSKSFKKLQGTSETTTAKQFFEEAYLGRSSVFHQEQIWNQSEQIPISAPVLVDTTISGVVQYFENKVLAVVPGLTNSFYHDDLKDAIPFNYGDGSYNYTVRDSGGILIPFGMGDWIVDIEAGVLTFYGTVPANMPPMITFYKYVGTKGVGITGDIPQTDIFVVNGTIQTNKTVTLSQTYNTDKQIYVFQNGLLLEDGYEWTVSNNVITFTEVLTPLTVTDRLIIKYYYE